MQKVLITVIGLAGYNVNKKEVNNKTIYRFNNVEKEYLNVLPLLIDEYKDYEIIPVYTSLSKEATKKILDKENKSEYFQKIFSHPLALPIQEENEENSYSLILKKIDSLLSKFNDTDEVILDISHGLRHIPILIVVNAIMHNIKNPSKIKEIIFAKEIERNKKYEIVDLKEYLDLANLSFILTNFKNNYTISSHIKFSKREYQDLINKMNSFSADVLALSIEHLLANSTKNLIESIDSVLKQNDMFKSDLEDIKNHISSVYYKREHRYLTYYEIAKDMFNKGYLVNVISLLFEGVGLYARRSFAYYDKKLADYLDFLEEEIKSNKKDKVMKDYYELSSGCRSYIMYDKGKNRDKYLEKFRETIYSHIPENYKFRSFVFKLNNIRNNLLHSNSGAKIEQVKQQIKQLLKSYEKFCIKDDVLRNKG